MSNICNSLNIKTLKISQLKEYETVNPNDIFLVIESGPEFYSSRRATFNNIANSLQYLSVAYNGYFTGSFLGNLNGVLTGSFTGSGKGDFDGNFSGNVTSNNFVGTGSFKYASNPLLTGSFYGVNYITNYKNSGLDVSFDGRSAYSVSSSFADTAMIAKKLSLANGVTDNFVYWSSTSDLSATDYLVRLSTRKNKYGSSDLIGSVGFLDTNGRLGAKNPIQFYNNTNFLLGEHITFQSASNQSIYGIGMQENTLYMRSDANFVMYHSGTYGLTDASTVTNSDSKDRKLNPGSSGYTSFVSAKRLVGIGHFKYTNKVNAQCHVHIDDSTGYRSGYNPITNAFLITSGSHATNPNVDYTKLLRVDGNGNLDVKNDIIALSTFGSSDLRLKNNITSIDNSFDLIEKLHPVKFTWNVNNKSDYGLIAQEVESNFPELVKEDMNGFKTIKYDSFIPILIESIKDLKNEIEHLKNKINKLENNS